MQVATGVRTDSHMKIIIFRSLDYQIFWGMGLRSAINGVSLTCPPLLSGAATFSSRREFSFVLSTILKAGFALEKPMTDKLESEIEGDH